MAEGQTPNVITPSSAQPEANWQFNGAEQQLPNSQPEPQPRQNQQTSTNAISWTASEFIAHDKSIGWYGLLVLGTILLAGVVYLFSRGDVIATGIVFVVAIVFGIFAARKPRELNYSVDNNGLKISDKYYPYSGFRSFSVVDEESVKSIWFMPLKRFLPPITIYFEPKDGQKITDMLSQFLPVENKKLDPVDKLMHRVRF